ncbi:class II aldolase/adducin family protein [Salinimonas sediminis]|uniref:Class II aldolase/adducin family protein n=1 Tax=Salinimonas sediminis TaxID=2303538 RepID=A0A346NL81_9ALTE|nr:class II aldolase/adducin family protein [Salinimonas sediminis]AXR06288.1 class II aldolase/adducin family protein [Salinimonas sediminis]
MTATSSSRDAMAEKLTIGAQRFTLFNVPEFGCDKDRQTYEKQRLAAAFRLFSQYGFDEGLAGHITLRDCIDPDTFWVNPVGIHFGLITVSDLVRVSHQGDIVEGQAAINNAAFAIHSRIHMARPDVNAVAHAHTTYGRAFAALGQRLLPISQDACMFYQNHALFSHFDGVVADTREGDMIAEALDTHCALILQNHGLLTVGSSVDAAAANFVMLDSCCHSQLLAQAAGQVKLIDDPTAQKTRAMNGSDLVTWGNFQPMYQKLLATDDSFLN